VKVAAKRAFKTPMLEFSTFVAVKREIAKDAMSKLNNERLVKGKSVQVRVM
jgi:DbpA RNA binding domain